MDPKRPFLVRFSKVAPLERERQERAVPTEDDGEGQRAYLGSFGTTVTKVRRETTDDQ